MTIESPSAYDVQLGARIADARRAATLTQAELAYRLGLVRSSVANIEAGRQRVLAVTVMEIAETLGCDPGRLLTGEGYVSRRRPVHMSQADRDQIKRGMSVLKTVAEVLERLAEVSG